MKRIQHGPVRGISLKLQEEERERRMDFIPDKSALDKDTIEIDSDTFEMLKNMGFSDLQKIKKNDRSRKGNKGGKKQGKKPATN